MNFFSINCMGKYLCRLIAFLLIGTQAAYGQSLGTQQRSPSLPSCPALFLTDAVVDHQGALWASSESKGLWRLPPGGSWQQMNNSDGFPQDSPNVYALAVDHQGRIWAGTAHEGVAVWNGQTWKTYNRLNGLVGDRVFDIQVNPESGDVAIATSGGLSIYSVAGKTWTSVTRAEGLAENQIESLAFTAGGALVAGYQCGGVGFSSPGNGWKKWNNIQAPWHWDEERRMYQPGEKYGTGLPSNLCNAVTTAGNGVWIGTSCGLAWLYKGKWLYTRGKDAEGKNKGIYGGLPSVFRKTGFPSELKKPELLPEDYITALLPCREGLWIGFRKEGAVLWDPVETKVVKRALHKQRSTKSGWVKNFVTLPNGEIYACTNGRGLQKVGETAKSRISEVPEKLPPHPKEAPPPQMKETVDWEANGGKDSGIGVVYAGEDWTTRGDWCGHYGQDSALLCAVNAPHSMEIHSTNYPNWDSANTVPGNEKIYQVDIKGYMGLHTRKNDYLRAWCHWFNKPDNRNVLYCPETGTRTEAEWDDHGEVYESSFDGPDIWVVTDIPEGLHEVALYFYNPNGQEQNAGYRDYLVEARAWKPAYPDHLNFLIWADKKGYQKNRSRLYSLFFKNQENRKNEIFSQQKKPVASRTRVKDFSGNGVYKRFLVKGPASCSFTIKRNASFNTIVNGIFVTRMDGKYGAHPILAPDDPYIPSVKGIAVGEHLPMNILSFWNSGAFTNLPSPGSYDRAEKRKLQAFRAMKQYLAKHPENEPAEKLKEVWKFKLALWDQKLRNDFDAACERSWAYLQKQNVIYRSKEWRPHSPNVLPLGKDELSAMEALGINWKDYLPNSTKQPEKSWEELKTLIKEHQQNNTRNHASPFDP